MLNIKQKVKKPSRALQYMLDGLEKQSRRRVFKINMNTFGQVGSPALRGAENSKICYGCAATCAVQEIAGKNLTPSAFKNVDADDYSEGLNVRAKVSRIDAKELSDFEFAIDDFRRGGVSILLQFFNFTSENPQYFELKYEILALDICMGSENWREEIPKVKQAIKILKRYRL